MLVYCLMQICCIEPLCLSQSTVINGFSHAVVEGLLFAMASLSKILVVAVRPSLHVHYKRSLTGSANTLPLLAWHFVNIRVSETERTTDPVLLFARDQFACFLQVACFFTYCCHLISVLWLTITCYTNWGHFSCTLPHCCSTVKEIANLYLL